MRLTIRDVARQAGVSVTTASRVLNNREDVSAETRQRVLAVSQRLQYVPSAMARGLVSGRAWMLGVVVNDSASPVYAEIVKGIETTTNAAGYGLLLGNSADSQEQALSRLAMLHASHIEGVLLAPVQTDRRDVEELTRLGVPFVLLLRHFGDLEHDYVVADNFAGGEMVTRHLLALGHRRIGHIAGPAHTSTAQGRLAGYCEALAAADLPYDESLVSAGRFTVSSGYDAALRLLDRRDRPSAVFAASDMQAVGVMKAARQIGLRIPDDLALAGGDDVELAEFLEIPLTTFRVPYEQIGMRAADILIARLEGTCATTQQIVFPPQLIVRRSCGSNP